MSKLKELEKRLKDEPDSLGLRVLVAGALHEAGRRDDSIELYRSVAVAYREQGRPQQAITVCRSILAIAPDDEPCQQLLASLIAAQTTQQEPAPLQVPRQPQSTPPAPSPRPPPPPRSMQPQPAPTQPARSMPQRSAQPQPVDRLTPPRLPRPPRPGSETDASVDDDPDLGPLSFADVTPLPAPLPYHVADPTASIPLISPEDLPPSLQEELSRYPEIAGIANAARQISASLIAARRQDAEAEEDDLSGELQTRRLPRITADDLLMISGPPPALVTDQIAVPAIPADLLEDEEPTLLPAERADEVSELGEVSEVSELGELSEVSEINDETTRPRELPLRSRPPSIAPPTSATGPLTNAFFTEIPPRNRGIVLQRFRRRMMAEGAAVIERGETGHGLIIVVRGLLELHAERDDGEPVILGVIAPGEYVGEISLLTRAPAPAQIVAAVDSELMVLGESDFYEVTAAFPALWIELKSVADRRKRQYDQRLHG
jgi:hypothetical protein